MNLLSFDNFRKIENLFQDKDKILVACSGGKDSMVLVNLLLKLEIEIGLCYIDHKTREGESAKDGNFVKDFAQHHNIAFFIGNFDFKERNIKSSSNFHKESRDFRYHFLKETAKSNEFSKIATAHHLDDFVESMFINLSRKSGLQGLKGIALKKDKIIRPLLKFSQEQISEYAIREKVVHITDASNFENKYKRNYFRNKISPLLKSWDNSFFQSTYESGIIIKESEEFLNHEINKWEIANIKSENSIKIIPLFEIFEHPYSNTLLYYILKKYGFNRVQTNDMMKIHQGGKTWKTEIYQIIVHQKNLLLSKQKQEKNNIEFHYYPFIEEIPGLGKVKVSDIKEDSLPKIKNKRESYIDEKFINENLCLRKWEDGDYMVMEYGRKKLKKIFNEFKISLYQKSEFWLLCQGKQVLWIVDLKVKTQHTVEYKKIEII